MVFLFGDIWLGNRHKPIFLNLASSQGLNRDNGPNCVVAGEIVMALPRKTKEFLPVFRFGDIWLGNRHKPIFLNLVLPRVLKGIMGQTASLRVELLWRFPEKNNDFLPVVRFGDIWLGNLHKPFF